MEENKKKNHTTRAAASAATALAATTNSSTPADHLAPSFNRGRGRGGRSRGRGRVNNNYHNNRSPGNPPSHPYIVFPQSWAANQWGTFFPQAPINHTKPPCPYPSVPKTPPMTAGILRPRPDQAYTASFTPTDIQQALYTMSLQQPDLNGYMDTGASGHMATPQGNISPSSFNSCTNKSIVVGNGMQIPVIGQGNLTLPPLYPPLKLNNVLYAPQIIKNLISVRKLTTDSLLSIEFDPFGFTVKDLKTKAPILRCNSSGDLYPLTAPLPKTNSQPTALTVTTQDCWHQRLGHPGDNLLHALKLSSSVSFIKNKTTLCQPCVFGKSVKFPFHDSCNATTLPFDIIHSDLWTSPGFIQSKSDTSLFIYHHGTAIAYLFLYVDDIILVTSSNTLRQRLMTTLASEFAMKDLGPLTYFLGILVTRNCDRMFLSQQAYTRDIIHRAAMDSCKPVATPADTNSKLGHTSASLFSDPTTYSSLAGALLYLTFTRPDISYAVQHICMHMHSLTEAHWNALKRIIRYLQGTLAYGLHLSPAPNLSLQAYTDADWAGCPDTRHSTSGYCVYLGDNLLSCSSKRQPTVSCSSAETEYRGVAIVVAEICWVRNILLELHRPLSRATLIYCDNVWVIYLSGNPFQHQRTKHIELDIHFVREQNGDKGYYNTCLIYKDERGIRVFFCGNHDLIPFHEIE
ncbi:uncharacterized protein LOC143634502 [Bidens hawaiensis]|uniref:uncharacterized protein LOC143634502 n=1 Tax=Bidens hawaiensis TaxID=980011 RepID=UPI00404A1535